MPDVQLDRVPGTVVTANRFLGPFETPAAALRFAVYTPLDLACVRSGWYGPDLEVALDDGERVVVTLGGLRLRTRGQWWLRTRAGARGELSDEPALLPFLRWWEMPIVQGNRLYVSGTVTRSSSSYRDSGAAPRLLRGGFLEQPGA